MSWRCNWIEFGWPAKSSLFLFTLFLYLIGCELTHGRLYAREGQIVAILGKDGSLLRPLEEFRHAVPQEAQH